jgi:hypothetical protein
MYQRNILKHWGVGTVIRISRPEKKLENPE